MPLDASDYHYEDGLLTISGLPQKCVLSVHSSCNPYENTALEGCIIHKACCVHSVSLRVLGVYVFTLIDQMFWRLFLCGLKRIRHRQLLSNGNLIETGEAESNRHFAL